MNQNIEIINPRLIGVRFDWVKAGFITDFPVIGKLENPHATLTDDGAIVLNKSAELYEAFKMMLNTRIMPMTDDLLQKHIEVQESRQDSPEWDKYAESYLWLLKMEQKRRTLEPKKTPLKWIQRLKKGLGFNG
jgi:hypothetical protein